MFFTSGFLTSTLGTVTVSTPSSIAAFTCSTLAFSGNLNLLVNLPLLRSNRCHVSPLSSFSYLLSPLIWRIRSSSTSTFTSSFFSPGTSAFITCAFEVSFQSMFACANDDVSEGNPSRTWSEIDLKLLSVKGKPSKGSNISKEKGSHTLDRVLNMLRINDIFACLGLLVIGFDSYYFLIFGGQFSQ